MRFNSELFESLPLAASNRPGLPRLRYPADDAAGLRSRLLARMAEAFPQWNPALADDPVQGDYGALLIDLFAHMGGILNVYADARANESFLRTAQSRRALIDLAQLVDYPLAPGASAVAMQAFLAKPGKRGSLPAGFRVQAPAQGKLPVQIFETLAAFEVSSERNLLRLLGCDRSARALYLSDIAGTQQHTSVRLEALLRGLRSGQVLLFATPTQRIAVPLQSATEEGGNTVLNWASGSPSASALLQIAELQIHTRPRQSMALAQSARADELALASRVIPLASTTGITAGQGVLVVSDGLTVAARVLVVTVGALQIDRPLPSALRRSATRVCVGELLYAGNGRVSVGRAELPRTVGQYPVRPVEAGDTLLVGDPVGFELLTVASVSSTYIVLAQPLTRSLRSRQTHSNTAGIQIFRIAATEVLEGGRSVPALSLGELPGVIGSGQTQLMLDRSYEGLADGDVLVASDGVQHLALSLHSASVIGTRTRLHFASALPASLRVASLRLLGPFEPGLRVDGYNRSEASLPSGCSQLDLIGTGLGLSAGNWLLLDAGEAAAQAPVATRLSRVEEQGAHTRVSLARPLEAAWPLANTQVFGNVVAMGHGAAGDVEILGSGDPALAPQRFMLRRAPLAFVADPASSRGLSPDLRVLVDERRWQCVESLADSGPLDHHFMIEFDERQRAWLRFGDGVFGAAAPRGRNNLRARYRVGLGLAGNVAAKGIRQMPQALPFIASSYNPAAAGGAAEPEDADSVRAQAAHKVRSLGRAVALADYIDLALAFGGIAKARADYVRAAGTGAREILLTVAMAGGGTLTAPTAEALQAYFAARAPQRPRLRLRAARAVAVRLSLQVTLYDDAQHGVVLTALQAALGMARDAAGGPALFAFERRALGAGLNLSEVYACVEAVAGVDHVLARAFHLEGAAAEVADRIALPEDTWASGGHSTDATVGRLALSLSGGVL